MKTVFQQAKYCCDTKSLKIFTTKSQTFRVYDPFLMCLYVRQFGIGHKLNNLIPLLLCKSVNYSHVIFNAYSKRLLNSCTKCRNHRCRRKRVYP